MPHLYITESNVKVGYSGGQLTVKNLENESERQLPFKEIDGISVFGRAQLSTQLIRECLSENIPIGFYSDDGHFFGHINSSERIDPLRQKKQIYLTDNNEFCVCWARRIVYAKIVNSLTLLTSMPEVYEFVADELRGLNHSLRSLEKADSVEMILGFEGNAAKNYFECLPKLLRNEDFVFSGRSARPPKDPFNSMLSYGYSLFYRNIIGAIERHGLHPYFAYMHKLKFGHAALASDLIEEYRAPLIDKIILEFVNSGEVEASDFYRNEAGALYMNTGVSKRLTNRFSDIIAKNQQYFAQSDDRKSYGFQVMLDMRIQKLIEAIEQCDASVYTPFIWKPGRS